MLLLRFALDDPSHLVYREAVRGLHHLVGSDPDELCLALSHPWTPGGLEPGVASEVHASDKVGGCVSVCPCVRLCVCVCVFKFKFIP